MVHALPGNHLLIPHKLQPAGSTVQSNIMVTTAPYSKTVHRFSLAFDQLLDLQLKTLVTAITSEMSHNFSVYETSSPPTSDHSVVQCHFTVQGLEMEMEMEYPQEPLGKYRRT